MRKSILLISMISCFILMLTGCGKTETVDYNLDAEIEKIISVDAYSEELLNKELQDSLKQEAVNEDLALLNVDLIGYKDAKNIAPIEYMFERQADFYKDKTLDWFGEKWTVNAFENKYNSLITGVRVLLGFDPTDEEYAQRKIRELTDKFLMEYGNIIYSSNIYEYDLNNLDESPVELVASIEDAFITYRILEYHVDDERSLPCIQIFFVSKENMHDISDNDLAFEIKYIKNVVDRDVEEVLLKTIKLDPNAGYIINEPKSRENMTPEEELISGGVFYN